MTEAPRGAILKRVPGTEKVVALAKREKSRPVFCTPAMRLRACLRSGIPSASAV